MDKKYFLILLKKHLNRKTTPEEQQLLFSYYELFQGEPDVISQLSPDEREELRNRTKAAIWTNIEKAERAEIKVVRSNGWYLRIAAAVILVSTLTAFYFLRFTKKEANMVTAIAVKKGESRFFRLPDSSTVVVAPGSSVFFPSTFDGQYRDVTLDGEAYFDIQHNASKPFRVLTGGVTVTVLGTAFSIHSFPNEKTISVTVTRGSVEVKDEYRTQGILHRNQQMIYDKQQARSVQQVVTATDFLKWRHQDLLFDDVTVGEIATILEAQFNVKIVVEDKEIKFSRFTTSFKKDENLEQILKIICEFNGAIYSFDQDKALVSIRRK